MKMVNKDVTDIVSGLITLAVGIFVMIFAYMTLEIGSLRRMGPGLFPMALGGILVAFGIAMLVPALFRAGPTPKVRIWTPIFVFAGISAFALTLKPFGLIPAVVLLTVISSFAELKIHLINLGLLCLGLCLMAWLLFSVGLGLNIPMFNWPV